MSIVYPGIAATFERVRQVSFEEKKEAQFDEEKINSFLDKILDFKQTYTKKTESLNDLIQRTEKLTWYTDVDQDSLMRINDLISSIRDLRSSLVRQYVSLNTIRKKGIAKTEISNFKTAIDDLKEVANDLESRFFFLPEMPVFQEASKELSLLK